MGLFFLFFVHPTTKKKEGFSQFKKKNWNLDQTSTNKENQQIDIPSGYVKIAIENCPVEIVDFPINSMVIFHTYVNVYQRVYPIKIPLNHYKSQ